MIKKALILGVLLSTSAEAGMFLDLDLATPINNYRSTGCVSDTAEVTSHADGSYSVHLNCQKSDYVGDSGTLGIVRVGYQTKTYQMGPVEVGAHVYYLHVSDWRMSDGGLDAIAAGVRIQ